MGYVLTNKTAQTPLGFGALGFALEPGQSRTITRAEAELIGAHPVVAGWVKEAKITVEMEGLTEAAEEEAAKLAVEEAEATRKAAEEEAAKLAAEEAEATRKAAEEEAAKLAAAPKVEPPKVPTPTKR